MLLMLDYGNFFEFRSGDTVVPLEGVECGKVYAMLITSNNGLWRYEIGDTVEFTSTNPYRIRFAGRTRQYINVFGEELIVDNADRALLAACNETGAVVGEYTVAPCYMSLRERGAHEWILEFEREPDSREHFAEALDRELRAVNSDYDAKRRTTLERQRLTGRSATAGFPRVDAWPGQEQGAAGWSTTVVWPTRYWRSAGKRSDGRVLLRRNAVMHRCGALRRLSGAAGQYLKCKTNIV